jgi:hypothetical protein
LDIECRSTRNILLSGLWIRTGRAMCGTHEEAAQQNSPEASHHETLQGLSVSEKCSESILSIRII